MSADLWKEFGASNGADLDQNPWAQSAPGDPADHEDWGEFEDPKSVNPQDFAQEELNPFSTSGENTSPNLATSFQSNFGILFDAKTEPEKTKLSLVGSGADAQTFIHGPLYDPRAMPFTGTKAVNRIQKNLVDVMEDNKDEDWADFEAPEKPEISSQLHHGPPDSEKADIQDMNLDDQSKASDPFTGPRIRSTILADTSTLSSAVPPPSNVPPPSVLLSLASTLMLSLPTGMKGLAISAMKAPSDQQRSENVYEITRDLSILRAIARIIAGRKHRWKRDNLLAQSVKIGPSHGGKAGGMKLMGVDRMEDRREDQEVAEVVKAWKQQAGILKAAVVKLASTNNGYELGVPEVSETLVARTVKGTLLAPKCCVICGLKRDERIEKVDAGMDDSFGEYWEQHWGHIDCKRFWDTYHGKLQQR